MTIFITASPPTDLSNYGGLKTSISAWLERDDLSDRIPYFIQMAEARFRRLIVNPEGEATLVLTPGATVTLPDDFDSARYLSLGGDPRFVVDSGVSQNGPSAFVNDRTTLTIGQVPTTFVIVGDQLQFKPAPTSDYPVTLVYRRTIPALTGMQPTNWLLLKHPDLYLYQSLIHAEFYGWNDARLPLMKSAVDEMVGEIQMAGNRKRHGGGPLYMRATNTDAAFSYR